MPNLSSTKNNMHASCYNQIKPKYFHLEKRILPFIYTLCILLAQLSLNVWWTFLTGISILIFVGFVLLFIVPVNRGFAKGFFFLKLLSLLLIISAGMSALLSNSVKPLITYGAIVAASLCGLQIQKFLQDPETLVINVIFGTLIARAPV